MLIEQWNNDIEGVTEIFMSSFESLSRSQLNWKPDKNKWSIAQNISHLLQLNNSYFLNFEEIKKGTHEISRGAKLQSIAARSLQTLQPYTSTERITKANTWSIWQPPDEEFEVTILADFTNHQSQFKRHIEELKPFLNGESFIKYPGEAELIFKLEDCINFLIEHEHRHWLQAEETKRAFTLSQD